MYGWLIIVRGCGHRNTGTVRIGKAGSAIWAKDSKALYYRPDDKGGVLVRYDLGSGKKTTYTIPDGIFDISPDEQSIVFIEQRGRIGTHHYRIYSYNLATKRKTLLYTSSHRIDDVVWLPQNKILFKRFRIPYITYLDSEQGLHEKPASSFGITNPDALDIYTLNVKDKRVTKILDSVLTIQLEPDWSGFYFRRVTAKDQNGSKTQFFVLDRTEKRGHQSGTASIPRARTISYGLSPDGLKYWRSERVSVHTGESELYLTCLPKPTSKLNPEW